MGLIFASAESGAPGVAFSFIHLHTIYTDCTPRVVSLALPLRCRVRPVRRHCGPSAESPGAAAGTAECARPAQPAQPLCVLSSVFYDLTPTQHTSLYKCTIATRTMQSAQPKTPLRSVERGRPLPPLVTRRAATLTRAPSPSHRRPHAPPSHALPSHALPLRITLSKSGAADPYLDESVVARGGHGCAIRRHCHRGHVPGWGWH